MNFSIDIGNTLIKVGIFDDNHLLEVLQYQSEEDVINLLNNRLPQNLIISSVKANLDELIASISREIKIIKLNHTTPLPIFNSYETPGTLGSDRISAIAGAYSLYPNTNSLVIDMGTCIKCDIIDYTNTYLGGSISPGIKMRFKSLNDYTSKLPLIDFEKIDFLSGKSTKNSILSGVINGANFEIEGYIQEYSKIFSQLNVIITGGDAYCFESRIKPHIFVVPNLVPLGLNNILLYNLSNTGA